MLTPLQRLDSKYESFQRQLREGKFVREKRSAIWFDRKMNHFRRRRGQISNQATQQGVTPEAFFSEIQKSRQKNGVGRPVAKCNWAQAEQMNRMHSDWFKSVLFRESGISPT